MDLGCVDAWRLWPRRARGWDARWRGIGPRRCGNCHLRTHRGGPEGRSVWNSGGDRPRSFWQAVDVGNAAEVTRFVAGVESALAAWIFVLPTLAGRRLNYSAPRPLKTGACGPTNFFVPVTV